jgi:hypothetical protein
MAAVQDMAIQHAYHYGNDNNYPDDDANNGHKGKEMLKLCGSAAVGKMAGLMQGICQEHRIPRSFLESLL